MKDRLKAIRKALDMTQQEFADQMGVSRAPIASCEVGRTEPTAALISLICRTYNVSEIWLRSGVGDMFVPRTRHDELAAYMGQLLGGKCTEMEEAIISVMARTSIDEWKLIQRKADELLEELKKPGQ